MGVKHTQHQLIETIFEVFNKLSFDEREEFAREVISKDQRKIVFCREISKIEVGYDYGLRGKYLCFTFYHHLGFNNIRFQPEKFLEVYEAWR